MTRRRLFLTTTMALLSLTCSSRRRPVLSRFSDYLDALRTQAGIPGLAAAIVGRLTVTWGGRYGPTGRPSAICRRASTRRSISTAQADDRRVAASALRGQRVDLRSTISSANTRRRARPRSDAAASC